MLLIGDEGVVEDGPVARVLDERRVGCLIHMGGGYLCTATLVSRAYSESLIECRCTLRRSAATRPRARRRTRWRAKRSQSRRPSAHPP